MSRIVLKVTNNKDHGEGSLRWAVGETQRHNVYGRRAEFDIIFDSEEPANNQLSTGYFTIGLKSPIRISRNNLRINHIDPRQVIIGPANALGGVNAKSQTLSSDSKRHSGSLFLIGSTNQGASAYRANGFAKEDRPIVSFNYFNFIRNIARGSDGQRGGGGGGLGTGGGISIFDGDLQVSNSVFQNLIAEGGAGGKGAKGGFGGNYPNKPKAGESGGRGGIPSWLPPTSVAHPRLAGRVAEGGKGGNPGETYNPPRGCNYKGPRNISPYRGYWGSAGKTPTRSDETIGFGSGGGGGAGGGGWYVRKKQDWFSCKTTPAHPETQDRGGRGGSPGLYGSRGGRGGKGGHRKNPGSEGSSGQQGAAVGAGIAIWSAPLGPTWSKDRPSKIDLLNVTFMGNRLEGDNRNISGTKYLPENAIDIFAAPRSTQYNTNVLNPQPQIHLENVNSGTSRQDTIPLKFGDLSNFDKLTDSQNPFFTESDNAPAFFGLSQPRVVDVSNMPNLRLKGTKNVSDMFDIGFETRANKIGITQDLTDPNNPLNRIWSELVPDKEDEIYAEHQAKIEEYQSQANQSYWEAIFTTDRLEDFAWSLAQNALGKGLEKAGGGSPAAGIVGGAVAGASISIARDSIAYFNNQKETSSNISRANEQLEADLIENRQKQDDLQNYLEEASQATLASFDPSLGRSVVVIKDFELGSDNLTFPAHPPLDREIVQINVNGGSQSSYELSYQLGDNSSTPFARIYLDEFTSNLVEQASCSGPECILPLLTLSDDGKTWNLGTKVSNTLSLSTREYTSGPGGINIVVDREQNKLPPNETIEIQTQIGRDYIIGTQGFEAINTGGNDDIVLPGGSTIENPDQINGAGGSDLVSYVSQQKPIEISDSGNERALNVSRKDSGTVIGELSNIENFHAFGPSSFDLSKLSPDDEYGIVSGSGSKIKGSEGDEQYQISLYDDYNIDLKTALSKKTVIDGNGGTNILFFNAPKTEDFEINSPEPKAFKVLYKGDIILKATDIDEFFFNDTNDWVSTRNGVRIGTDGPNHIEVGDFIGQPIDGLAGDDTIIGSNQDDTLIGGSGFDILKTGDGNDIVEPGYGNFLIKSTPSNDSNTYKIRSVTERSSQPGRIEGTVKNYTSEDQINFVDIANPVLGENIRVIQRDKTSFIVAHSLGMTRGGEGGGALILENDNGINESDVINSIVDLDIPRIIGTNGPDLLEVGDLIGQPVDGLAGDDTIIGSNQDDTLIGGSGFDILKTGDGNDIVEPGYGDFLIKSTPSNDSNTYKIRSVTERSSQPGRIEGTIKNYTSEDQIDFVDIANPVLGKNIQVIQRDKTSFLVAHSLGMTRGGGGGGMLILENNNGINQSDILDSIVGLTMSN